MGLAALVASAYMCSRSPQGTGGTAGYGHVVDGAAGAPWGGGSGGSGGIVAAGGSDAGPTGILPCASLPPSSEPVPAGWPAGAKRLPALDPDVYVFDVPPDPAPLTWKACGTGCRELVNTWAPSLNDGLEGNSKGGVVGGIPWLMLRRRYPDHIGTWIGPADAPAVEMLAEEIAHGTVPHAFSSPVGIGADGYVIGVYYRDSPTWTLGATLQGPLRCMFVERNPAGSTQDFFHLATSSSRWALWPDGNGPGWSGELPIGSPSAPVPAPVPLPAGYARGDGFVGIPEGFVMASYVPATTALFVWTPASGTVPFVGAPPPDASDEPVASDGNRVAWLHGSGLTLDGGAEWSKVELVIATESGQFPVTGTAAGRLPTSDAWTDSWAHSALHGDYFAGWVEAGWPHPPTPIQLVPFVLRLTDLRIWIIPPRSADLLWRDILYLSDDEIALRESTRATHTVAAHTIVRYRLDSLGPGQALDDALDGGVP